MKVKKALALLLTGVMTVGILVGCGGKTSSSDNSASKEGEDGETMSIMLNGSSSDAWIKGYLEVIDEFNKNNKSGITVKAENVSNSDYKTKLTTMMASDSEPDVIFTWELGYLQNFVDGKKVISLQKYLDEDKAWMDKFNPGTLEQLTYDHEVYGVPTQQAMALMYYNKKIFDQYGLEVPNSYEEYRAVCDTLKENGVTPVALASTADDAWLVSQYIQQLSNGLAGGELFDGLKNGTVAWNDSNMVKAAELFQEEVQKGYFEEGFTGVTGQEAEAIFQNGQAAMYFNGSWEISNLTDTSVTPESDNISCFAMPGVDSANNNISVGSVDTAYAITENCKNVDAAVELLKYFTSDEVANKLLYEYGRNPATNSGFDESKLTSLNKDALKVMTEQKQLTPWFDRVNTDIGNEFNNTSVAIANGDEPKEMFDKLAEYAKGKS